VKGGGAIKISYDGGMDGNNSLLLLKVCCCNVMCQMHATRGLSLARLEKKMPHCESAAHRVGSGVESRKEEKKHCGKIAAVQ
jgi:hypothetical protein